MDNRAWQEITEEVEGVLLDYGLNEYGEVNFYNYDYEKYNWELDRIADYIALVKDFENDLASYLRRCCSDEHLKCTLPHKAIKKILEKSNCIITFNYTHTAEIVYGVQKIIHIHGDLNESIAIGSGALEDAKSSTVNYKYPSRKDFSNDKYGLVDMMKYYSEDMDGNLVEDHFIRRFFDEVSIKAEEKEEELFNLLDEKSKDALAERQDTIDILKNNRFDLVYIIGHSLSDADYAVFNSINKDAHIICFYHSKREQAEKELVLNRLGFINFEMIADVAIYE